LLAGLVAHLVILLHLPPGEVTVILFSPDEYQLVLVADGRWKNRQTGSKQSWIVSSLAVSPDPGALLLFNLQMVVH
jgi:WD40 repeat protein